MSPEWAKVVTMLTLGLGSMIIGLLPAAFTNYNLRRSPLLLTFLLCFGAGILMATSLVHMLPEVSEDLGHGFAEIIFCVGFLIVYLADELLHFCCGEAIQHSHDHNNLDEERQLILPVESSTSHSHQVVQSYGTTEKTKIETCEEHQHHHDVQDELINERICHTSHVEPCRQTLAGVIGMLTALSIHALIEGLAIGIQDTTPRVMILFTAVISHKFVVGFCLGVELSVSAGATFKHHFAAIFVFSMGSVLGIAIGMGLVDLSSVSDSKFLPIMQGIAGGTLLYVTVCEVLPREKARWHQNRVNRAAGLSQLLAFTLGFTVMTLLNTYVKDD
jgi:zinc transporter 1/2/3